MAPQQQQNAALKRMLKLVNALIARADSGPFREPVDWRGLELWDYPKVIKKMMDLGTVKRKLERGSYTHHSECAEDIRLIWFNCLEYNADGSDFWQLAKSFSRKFEDRYKKIEAEFGDAKTESRSQTPESTTSPKSKISLERKTKFASNIFLLNGMELGHVITTCELQCPEVLEDLDGDTPQVEINVDAMPSRIFSELESYIQEKVGGTEHAPPSKKRKK